RLPGSPEVRFEAQWQPGSPAYLADHRVYGTVVVPAAAHIAMVVAAAQALQDTPVCALTEVSFPQALVLAEAIPCLVQLILTPQGETKTSFHIVSGPNAERGSAAAAWTTHATGHVRFTALGMEDVLASAEDVATIQSHCPHTRTGADFYAAFQATGYGWGPAFQWLEKLWQGTGEALGHLIWPRGVEDVMPTPLHPGLLDSCFHVLAGCGTVAGAELAQGDYIYLPVGIAHLRICGTPQPGQAVWCYARLRDEEVAQQSLRGDLRLYDDSGQVLIDMRGFEARRARRDVVQRGLMSTSRDWFYTLQWRPVPPSASPSLEVTGGWLICADATLGPLVAARLRAQGAPCVQVLPGATYAQLTTEQYQLNPLAMHDWRQVLQSIKVRLQGIVHLWGLTAATPDPGDLAALSQAQELGCGST